MTHIKIALNALLTVTLSGALQPAYAGGSPQRYNLEFTRQPLVTTLKELSSQTGLNTSFVRKTQNQQDVIVGPLKGEYTVGEALDILLADTGLTFKETNAQSVAIVLVAPSQRRVMLSIEELTLSDALNEWALQTGLQVILEVSDEWAAPSVKGMLTAQTALDRLLANTSLTYEWLNDRVVVVTERIRTISPVASQSINTNQPSVQIVRLNGAEDQGRTESPVVAPRAARSNSIYGRTGGGSESLGARVDNLEEIVVTGTHIRGIAPAGANIISIDRQAIRESGRGTIAEVLQTVPQVHGSGPTEAFGGPLGNLGYGSSLNLRGLGVEETLTLINGRRLAPGGLSGQFADVSLIPLAAIERVDILPDGASATYGADAMAGVVNIRLRKKLDGVEARVRYGSVTEGSMGEVQGSATAGTSWESGRLIAAYEYYHRDDLPASARRFTASNDLRSLGGTDWRVNFGNPGNISSPGALAGAIPSGQDGTTLTADQILRGQSNLDNARLGTDFLPEQERNSFFISAEQDIGSRVSIYADVLGSEREALNLQVAPLSTLSVPVTNAYRQLNGLHGTTSPLNQTIRVSYSFFDDFGPTPDSGLGRTLSAALGGKIAFPNLWQLDTYVAYGTSKTEQARWRIDVRPAAQGGALNIALASPNIQTAFNPFGDGSHTDPSVLATLLVPTSTGTETDYVSMNTKLSGDLFELPGGEVKFAVGGEYRDESFDFVQDTTYFSGVTPPPPIPPVAATRSLGSAFAEFSIPLFSERNQRVGLRNLDLSLSARYDHYSDFGDTTNPKLGLRWKPATTMSFRGTYGTSFKAPLLNDLFVPAAGLTSPFPASLGGPDPSGDGFTNTLLLTGGNSELEPEEGTSWTVGLDLSPETVPQLAIHLTYFDMEFENRISSSQFPTVAFQNPTPYLGTVYFPNPSQSLVDAYVAAASTFITTPPAPGTIEAIFDERTANLSVVTMNGLDFGLEYAFKTRVGEFRFLGSATYTDEFDQKFTTTAPTQVLLDTLGQPVRMRARAGVDWVRGGFSANVFANHVGAYHDRISVPNRDVGSFTTVDASFRLDFDRSAISWMDGLTAALYVINAFDREPPFANNSGIGFDSANASALGRMIAIEMTKNWGDRSR